MRIKTLKSKKFIEFDDIVVNDNASIQNLNVSLFNKTIYKDRLLYRFVKQYNIKSIKVIIGQRKLKKKYGILVVSLKRIKNNKDYKLIIECFFDKDKNIHRSYTKLKAISIPVKYKGIQDKIAQCKGSKK